MSKSPRTYTEKVRDYFLREWKWRIFMIGIAVFLGFLSGLVLNISPLLQAANRAVVMGVQDRLGNMSRDTSSVTMVDLSTAIGLRPDRPIALGEVLPDGTVIADQSQLDFLYQVECLIETLEGVRRHKPKAIFVDWQATAPLALWDPVSGRWRRGTHPDFVDAFSRLLDKVDEISVDSPVFIVGDLMQEVVASRLSTGPGRRFDVTLLSSALISSSDSSLFPLAPIQEASGTRMPSVTDGLVRFLDLEDKVASRPSKWGLFNAVINLGQKEAFWIDYGFVPDLVDNALYLNNTDWSDPMLSKSLGDRLAGKIVVIADMSQPHASDVMQIPVRPERLVARTPQGTVEVKGSGGIAHAAALLTRIQSPLYALPGGWQESVLFAVVNVLIAVVVWIVSALLGGLFPTSWGDASEGGLELLLLVATTFAFAFWAFDWMARSRVMIPQVEGFLVTRFVDTMLLGAGLIRNSFVRSKPLAGEEKKLPSKNGTSVEPDKENSSE